MYFLFDFLVHPSIYTPSGKYSSMLAPTPCLGGGLIYTGNEEKRAAISEKEDDVETVTSADIKYRRESLTDEKTGTTWHSADNSKSATMD